MQCTHDNINEEADFSDNSQTWSSTSIDHLNNKRIDFAGRDEETDHLDLLRPETVFQGDKCSRTSPSQDCLGRPSLMEWATPFKRKQKKLPKTTSKFLSETNKRVSQFLDSEEFPSDGSGDHLGQKHPPLGGVQKLYPAMLVRQTSAADLAFDQGSFPFQSTPSGHLKVKPSQVVYESKNLSIVAADPKSVLLNLTESCKSMDGEGPKPITIESVKKKDHETWQTTTLYTTATMGGGGGIPFGSDTADTVSESDGGGAPHNKVSELSLTRMGYVTDNNVEWNNLKLPDKSELQKLLLQIVLNRKYSDIHIKLGGSIVKCHRIVLQCYSTYFVDKLDSVIEIPENLISKEVFELIYKWMLHLERDSYRLLKRENILSIFNAARFLGVKELEEQCWSFIDNIDVFYEDKAFLLYMDARKNNNEDVMSIMIPRVQRFFLTLVSSKEFVEFSVEEVCTFLCSNYICVHSEMEVFMAAIRWLSHNWPQRKPQAAKVMKCVRFGFINPRLLITMRRGPQSPEFQRIANIPEVSQMIDDGVALVIAQCYYEKDSEEDYNKNLKSLNLSIPAPRNWDGTEKNYQSYEEFLKSLGQYRSKQRLELKRSRMKMEMENVNDDFLSSAVLPPSTHQKFCKKLQNCDKSLVRCLPQLEPKELELVRKMICHKDKYDKIEGKDRQRKVGDFDKLACGRAPHSENTNTGGARLRNFEQGKPATPKEKDEAARKIQKYYRTHSKRTLRDSEELNKDITTKSNTGKSSRFVDNSGGTMCTKNSRAVRDNKPKPLEKSEVKTQKCKGSSLLPEVQDEAAKTIQRAYRKHHRKKTSSEGEQSSKDYGSCKKICKSHSDPSFPSSLLRSSIHTPDQCDEGSLPIKSGRSSVFVLGGANPFDECGPSTGLEILKYVNESNTWQHCGYLPEPLHYHSAVYFHGYIYVAGGKDPTKTMEEPGTISRHLWRFDPGTRHWSQLRSMRFPRRSFGFVPCNNKLFVIGGRNHNNDAMASVERYDPDSDLWMDVRGMHVARAGPSTCEFKGRIWVAGGLTAEDNFATSGVEYYNYHHNMWIQSGALRYSIAYGVMLVIRDKLYIIGGAIGLRDTNITGSGKQIEVWEPESHSWCLASMMSKPRHGHAAVYLENSQNDDGHLFIVGGLSLKHEDATDSVEVWRETDDVWVTTVANLPCKLGGVAGLALPTNTFA